jgi:hypothetical protein
MGTLTSDGPGGTYKWTDPMAIHVNRETTPSWYIMKNKRYDRKNCKLSDSWGPYQIMPINPMLEYAVKTVLQQPMNGGSPCGEMLTYRNANADCVGAWEPWGECSNGSRIRKYNLTENGRGTGAPCPFPNGERQVEMCVADCEGQWTPWSTTCTDGRERRTYSITKEKVGTGKDCVAKDKEVEFRPCTGGATTTSPAPPSTGTTPPSTKTSPPSTGAKTTTPPPIPWHKQSIIVAGVKIPVVWLIGGFGFIFAVFMILIIL